MQDIQHYPKAHRKSIRKLCDYLCVDVETAYAMLLITSALMDLRPEDNKVIEIILMDNNMEVEV